MVDARRFVIREGASRVPISYVTCTDVLFGRGTPINRRAGNKFFHELVRSKKREYLKKKKSEKILVARDIVKSIRGRTPPGRFLKRDDEDDYLFVEVGDIKAEKKTLQALREGAPELRQELCEATTEATTEATKPTETTEAIEVTEATEATEATENSEATEATEATSKKASPPMQPVIAPPNMADKTSLALREVAPEACKEVRENKDSEEDNNPKEVEECTTKTHNITNNVRYGCYKLTEEQRKRLDEVLELEAASKKASPPMQLIVAPPQMAQTMPNNESMMMQQMPMVAGMPRMNNNMPIMNQQRDFFFQQQQQQYLHQEQMQYPPQCATAQAQQQQHPQYHPMMWQRRICPQQNGKRPPHKTHKSGITCTDVLLGAGGHSTHNAGNKFFRQLIRAKHGEYLKANDQDERRIIVWNIVKSIRGLTPPGRFLKKDYKEKDSFVEVGDIIAKKKTWQLLKSFQYRQENK